MAPGAAVTIKRDDVWLSMCAQIAGSVAIPLLGQGHRAPVVALMAADIADEILRMRDARNVLDASQSKRAASGDEDF